MSGGKSPKMFIFENVKGILSSKMKSGLTVPEEIRRRMGNLGYKTFYRLLTASDYGVPQNRQRVIMVGVKKDMPDFDFKLLDDVVSKHDLYSVKNDNYYELTLGSILSDLPDTKDSNDYWKYSPTGQKMIEEIGPCIDGAAALPKFRKKIPFEKMPTTIKTGRSWKNMSVRKMTDRFKKIWDNPEKYHAPNFYRRFALGEICGTITASGQPENSGITHPFENRRFSIREIARIQSFPDDFVFPYNSISEPYKVIGNAVPPVMAWVLAKAVESYFENAD